MNTSDLAKRTLARLKLRQDDRCALHYAIVKAVRDAMDVESARRRLKQQETWAEHPDQNESYRPFCRQQAAQERLYLEAAALFDTLTPDNATDLLNVVLYHALVADGDDYMLGLELQIAGNELKLYDTPSGQYDGHPSPFLPVLWEHLPDTT